MSPIAGMSIRAINRPVVSSRHTVRYGATVFQLHPDQARPGACVHVERCGPDDWNVLDLHGRVLRWTAHTPEVA